MTIQIPDDLAKGLENIAALRHKSVEQLALESLRSACEPPGSPQAILRLLREMRPVSAEEAAARSLRCRRPIETLIADESRLIVPKTLTL
jgi:hypothetical protein